MRSLALALLAPCIALADDSFRYDLRMPDIYIFGHVGQARASNWCSLGGACDNVVTTYGGGLGFQLTNSAAIEVSAYSADKLVTVIGSAVVSADADVQAVTFVPSIHLADTLSAQFRFGAARWDIDVEGRAPGARYSANATGFSMVLGVGLALQLSPQFALRTEFIYIPSVGDSATTGRSDLTAITLGAVLSF